MTAFEAVQILEQDEISNVSQDYMDALAFAIESLKEKAVNDAWEQTKCMHCKFYDPISDCKGTCSIASNSVRYKRKTERRAKEQACKKHFVPRDIEEVPGKEE